MISAQRVAIIIIISLSYIPTFAGGFKIAAQGQKQLGMAHTGVGLALDASNVYFNVGSITQVTNSIVAGASFILPSTQYLDAATNTSTYSAKQVFTPFQLFATSKLKKNLYFGIGIYTPFGSGIKYPSMWPGQYVLTQIDLKAIFIQPSIAYQINKHLSIGLGLIASSGSVLLTRNIPLTNINGQIPQARLFGNAYGYGLNTGLYYTHNKFSAGLVYKSKVTMSVNKGLVDFVNIPAIAENNFVFTTFNTSLPLPAELAIGTAYQVNKKLTLLCDISHTYWKSFDSLRFNYDTTTAAITNSSSPRLYKNASTVRLGAQYMHNTHVTLRAGMLWDQTPTQQGYIAPELPDNNKWGITIGASYRVNKLLQIDASLLYENVPARANKNIETQLEGTFATKVIAPGIGIHYYINQPKNNTPNATQPQ
jgi:long-chain fatty acid transport protein